MSESPFNAWPGTDYSLEFKREGDRWIVGKVRYGKQDVSVNMFWAMHRLFKMCGCLDKDMWEGKRTIVEIDPESDAYKRLEDKK